MSGTHFLAAALLAASLTARCQDFSQSFADLIKRDDTTAELTLLHKWEAASRNDAELYIAWFNYYARKSMTEYVTLGRDAHGSEVLKLRAAVDTGDAGYLGDTVIYDQALLQKAFRKIDEGIARYPARLDMRFGKVYMLGECGNYAAYAAEIVKAVEYGHTIDNRWIWKDGPMKDAREFMLNSVQDYQNTLFRKNNDTLLPYMTKVARAVLKYYPDNVESLCNLAVSYLIPGDIDKALPYLLKAEKVAPKDAIVQSNLAEAYLRKHDKARAKEYYQKMLTDGSPDEQEFATEQLKHLQ